MYSSLRTLFALELPGFPELLPQWLSAGILWAMASLVVYACQRLAESAALSVDRASRKVSDSLASVGIGTVIWALDIAACAVREDMRLHEWPLSPSLAALLLTVLVCRLTVPVLIYRSSWQQRLVASLGLAAGVMLAHLVIVTDCFVMPVQMNSMLGVLTLCLMAALIAYRSWRYQHNRLSHHGMHTNSWAEWLACGGAIVLLHGLLAHVFVRIETGELADASFAHGVLVPVMVGVFAGAMALEQFFNMRSDQGRQQFFQQGLSLMRADGARLPSQADTQLALIADHLHQLIHPQRLVLHFQPIADMRTRSLHMEALLRLEHDRLGRINPEHFFLACELRGRTLEVDRLIIANALDHAVDWHAQGLQLPVHVNLAPSTMMSDGFVQWLGAQLAQRALPASQLRLELTEHAIIERAQAMSGVMEQLLGIGVEVLMDDFGSGYSSLGLLADLRIAGIKCDRAMVRNLAQDARRQTLLQHVAAMARDLQLQVTVEGVENEVELHLAARCGIDCIQGYLFARPMPAADVPRWMAQEAPARLRAMVQVLAAKQEPPALPAGQGSQPAVA